MSSLQTLTLVAALCCTTSAQAAPMVKKIRLSLTRDDRTRQVEVEVLKGKVTATRSSKNLSYTAEGTKGISATLRKDLLALASMHGVRDAAPNQGPFLEVWYTDGSKATVNARARMGDDPRVGQLLLKLEVDTMKAVIRRDHLARIERVATAALIKLSVANLPFKSLNELTSAPNDPSGLGPRLVLELYSSSNHVPERWTELESRVLDVGGPALAASGQAVIAVLRQVLHTEQLHIRSLGRVGIHAPARLEAFEAEALARAIRAASKVGIARLRRDLGSSRDLLTRARVAILGPSAKSAKHVRVRSEKGQVRVAHIREINVEVRLDGFVPIKVPGLRNLDAKGAALSIP